MGDPNGPCRCPDCDPVVAAGYNTCGGCHGRAYALDAAWITDRLIMTSFGPIDGDPGCTGSHRARLVLLDVDAEDSAIPRIQPRTCRGTVRADSRKGQPCRNAPATASAYCYRHDPARQEAS